MPRSSSSAPGDVEGGGGGDDVDGLLPLRRFASFHQSLVLNNSGRSMVVKVTEVAPSLPQTVHPREVL